MLMSKTLIITVLLLINIGLAIAYFNYDKVQEHLNYIKYQYLNKEMTRKTEAYEFKPEISKVIGKQIFYGKWKIVKKFPSNPDTSLYQEIVDGKRKYIFPDAEKYMVGKVITLTKDYIECEGIKYYFVDKSLNDTNLNISLPGVIFMETIQDPQRIEILERTKGRKRTKEENMEYWAMRIEDLTGFEVKDKNLMYAYGYCGDKEKFLLERIED